MSEHETRRRSDRPLALWGMLIVGVILLGAAAAGVSLRERLAGRPSPEPPVQVAEATATTVAAPGVEPRVPALDLDEMRRMLDALPAERRAAVLADARSFNGLVAQEAARRAVLRAAYARRLQEDERIAFLVQRGAEQVLVESFLRAETDRRLPADFPTPQQLRQFYEANKARYSLEDRVAVWQIFLPVPADADATAIAAIEADAGELADRLRRGEITFADAAARHSAHVQSRVNGGYMGILNVSALVPEVRERIATLDVGEISDPVRGAAGFHVVKHGERIAAGAVPLDQISSQVRADARRAALARLRLAVMQESRQEHGEPLTEAGIEAWRERLRVAAGK